MSLYNEVRLIVITARINSNKEIKKCIALHTTVDSYNRIIWDSMIIPFNEQRNNWTEENCNPLSYNDNLKLWNIVDVDFYSIC